MKYYHNPRCAKSREGLQLLTDQGIEPEVVDYMNDPLTPAELEDIIGKLGISAADLLRKKEQVWKDEYADLELSEEELILAMIDNPKLMERPILVNGEKAAVGRPPENLLQIV